MGRVSIWRGAEVVLGETVNWPFVKTDLGSWPGSKGLECQATEVGLFLVKGHSWDQFLF